MSSRAAGRRPATTSKKNKEARSYAKALLERCLALPKPAPDVLDHAPKKIRLGSDCAGYGTDRVALALCGLETTVAFTSEADHAKRPMLAAVHALFGDREESTKSYKNVCTRKNATTPQCDLFIAGPPCPAFSKAGKRAGLDDRTGRGSIAFYCLDYVAEKRPRVCIIENVKGLLEKKHAKVLQTIEGILQALGYEVHRRVLNTLDHGIPQSRQRVYVVALRDVKRPFKWPRALPTPSVKDFLDQDLTGQSSGEDLNFFAEKAGGMRKLANRWYVIDLGSSKRFQHLMREGVCPCLTRTRCGSAKYFVPKLKRFMTLAEMATLQGLPNVVTRAILQAANGDEKLVGKAIGDAMSVNVLVRLVPRALFSAGLLDTLPADVFKEASQTSLPLHPDQLMA